jgi:hypothetical protein
VQAPAYSSGWPIEVVFKLRTRWTPNIEINSPKLFILNTRTRGEGVKVRE